MRHHALEGVKVLDLTQGVAGPYCTKLLGALGAEVVKVEPPGLGDEARRVGPFLHDEPHAEKSALYLYLNTGKLGVTLNLKSTAGLKIAKELIQEADVLVENFGPGVMTELGLAYDDLSKVNPGLVMTSMSNFGTSGPYRDYKRAPIVDYALGNYLYNSGDPDREPLMGGGRQPEYATGLHAFLGTMAALFCREATGRGQQVETSIMESMAGLSQYSIVLYAYTGRIRKRLGNRYDIGHPLVIYPCKDGHVNLAAHGQFFEQLCYAVEHPELLTDPRFESEPARLQHADELDSILLPWFQTRDKKEIAQTLQEWRIVASPVLDLPEVLDDPQYQARDFWVDVDHPETGTLRYPGAPFKMSETPWEVGLPAPLLGEHNEKVFGRRLGYPRDDLIRLRQLGVI